MTRADRGDEGGVAVAQDGARVLRAVPAAVPSPHLMSGAATTGSLVAGTFRARP